MVSHLIGSEIKGLSIYLDLLSLIMPHNSIPCVWLLCPSQGQNDPLWIDTVQVSILTLGLRCSMMHNTHSCLEFPSYSLCYVFSSRADTELYAIILINYFCHYLNFPNQTVISMREESFLKVNQYLSPSHLENSQNIGLFPICFCRVNNQWGS